MSTTNQPNSATLIVGLSGPSSSGKTTLARLLRQVSNVSVPLSSSVSDGTSAPPSSLVSGTDGHVNGDGSRTRSAKLKLFILHEDDFYKTDTLIPRKQFTSPTFGTRALEDWDCIESLDLPLFSATLSHIKSHGVLPPDMVSKEDQNTVGKSGVSDDAVEKLRGEVVSWVSSLFSSASLRTDDGEGELEVTICLLDGFLLYTSPESAVGSEERELADMINGHLDAKLFVPSTRAQTIERRTKRTGYVTLEGFWEDPPGYVEDVVWPNFRKDHGWLFEKGEEVNGNTNRKTSSLGNEMQDDDADAYVWEAVDEGKVDRQVAEANGISIGPGAGEVHLRDILPWAVDKLKQAVESKVV